MANKNLTEKEKMQQEIVEEKVSSVENFFNNNKKTIWGILCLVVICGLSVLAYHKFYLQPKKAEAQQQMFPAEANFRSQNYELALNGDGNVLGFSQIEKEYGSKAGESVYLYAGICELQLGKYEEALSYLKKYNGKDKILKASALGAQGDAYAGLNKLEDALSCYEKAANVIDNAFTSSYLKQAGIVCEELGKNDKALTFYKKIKDMYPQSPEGYDIDKYISRIEFATTK